MLLPVKADIKVLVMVPIISLPIFNPDLINCPVFKLLFTSFISNSVDVIDILVSIIAPSDEINIPEKSKFLMFNDVLVATNNKSWTSAVL